MNINSSYCLRVSMRCLSPRGARPQNRPGMGGEQSRYIFESFYFSSTPPSTRSKRWKPPLERNFAVPRLHSRCERTCNSTWEIMMKLKAVLLSAALGAGALAGLAVPAAADIVCNREGDCWHADSRYDRPGIRFDYHPDDWYFHREWRD